MKLPKIKFPKINWNKWVPLLSGTWISVVSAYYSILGLAAIFPATPVAIMIMGASLELGKVVTASYLYRNWKTIPWGIKTYFVIAVIVLMSITSMGSFGFLSNAHVQNAAESSIVSTQIASIDQQIAAIQRDETRSQQQLNQLDAALNSIISQGYASRALILRSSQRADRESLQQAITDAEARIATLQQQKLPLQQQQNHTASEVGPIRYVAELIFNGRSSPDLLEAAVRYMIVLLVIVFDPLAVMLIMISTANTEPPKEPRVKRTRTKVQNVDPNVVATIDGTNFKPMNVSITPNISDDIINRVLDNPSNN